MPKDVTPDGLPENIKVYRLTKRETVNLLESYITQNEEESAEVVTPQNRA